MLSRYPAVVIIIAVKYTGRVIIAAIKSGVVVIIFVSGKSIPVRPIIPNNC